MKILFVSSQLMFADTRCGGARRLYYYARALEKRHDLKVICIDGNSEGESLRPEHRQEFRHFLWFPVEFDSRPLTQWLTIDLSASLDRRKREIQDFLGTDEYDAVLLAFPFALSFLKLLSPANLRNVTYLEDDLYPEIVRHQIEDTPNFRARWTLYRRWYRKTLEYYQKCFRSVSRVIAVSHQEAAILSRFIPRNRIRILGNGFDLTRYPFLPVPPALALGFIGYYRHQPNADSLDYILKQLLPEMKKHWPSFRLVLAGKSFPKELVAPYRDDSQVEIMEDIPDAADFYRRIAIFINPIISGRGMRSKLVEAAAFGRPIVSTTLGAEGAFGMKISIADDPVEFVRRCGELARDAERYAAETRHNRETVERDYNIESVLPRLEAVLSEAPPTGVRPSVREAGWSIFARAFQGIRQWKMLRPW